jgi:ABC transporter substrate binding protein
MDRRRFLLTSLPMMRESFFQGLRDLGYVEGRNVRIEYRDAQESQELLGPLAAEPIVMVVVLDPVKNGFVRSFARPGGNITGLSSLAQAITSKQVELLKEILPSISRLAVLQNPDNQNLRSEFADVARVLKLDLEGSSTATDVRWEVVDGFHTPSEH